MTEPEGPEASIRRAQERLRTVMDALPALIAYIDREYRFVFVNSAYAQFSGLVPQEAAGKAVREVVGREAFARIEPYIARALAGEKAAFEDRFPLAGGGFRDFRVQYVPERDAAGGIRGVIGLAIDVTEERASRRLLAERETRFRSVFEIAQEGVAIHRDGVILQANTAMARLLGAADPSALVGMHVADLVTPEYRDSVRQRSASLRAGEVVLPYAERRLQRLDGGSLDVEMSGASFIENGERHMTMVVRDLSDRKAHERKILELNESLERRVAERTAELSGAYREMEAFSYSVSHDLRAPLRAIAGFSGILLQDFEADIPDEAKRLLLRVVQNAERMGALIEGLLELGRLSRQPLRRRQLNPADLVGEVLEESASALDGRGIEIRVGEMPGCEADRLLLKQVYANLIGNAIKYTRRRERASIEIGANTAGPVPVYYVRDNGAGFDMTCAQRLFGVFERLHSATDFEGTGVGLALVRRIVERHGGKVWAESVPDSGATFYFSLAGEPGAVRDP
jgi:hypothetical protein